MQVFFINLDRSPERRVFMTNQLQALGLPFERVAAIDGKTADLGGQGDASLTQTEIACFLSHRACWTRLAGSADEYGIILEDDVRLSRHFAAVAADTAWLAQLSGIAKLDTSGRKVLLDQDSSEGPAGLRFHRLRSEHTGCAGYILSRKEALALLAQSTGKLRRPVDLFVFGERSIVEEQVIVWQAVPAVVAQEKRFAPVEGKPMESVIGSRRKQRGAFTTVAAREVRRSLRKFKRFLRVLPARLAGKRIQIRVPFA